MKKTRLVTRAGVVLLTCLLLAAFALASCGEREGFYAKYPKGYTSAYFHDNYVQCDPNLIHLKSSRNSAGKYKDDPYRFCYYAIEGVSMEEYVCYSEDIAMFDPDFDPYIARNGNMEMPKPEVLTWTVTGAELYWCENKYFDDGTGKMIDLGDKRYYLKHADLDGGAFQSYLGECLANGEYRESIAMNYIRRKQGSLELWIRLHFAEYENIVWDGEVLVENDVYYVLAYVWVEEEDDEGYYDYAFVPLSEEIVELIPKY